METLGTPQRSAMAPAAAASGPPSFVSPAAAATGASSSAIHTLSGGARKKLKKRPLTDAHKESTQPQSAVRHKIKKRLQQRIASAQGDATTQQHTAKKLVFAGTPVKSSSKIRRRSDSETVTPKRLAESVSSSDSSSSDSEASSASSDECEVAFEAVTLGDTRIIREASASPMSTCSTTSSASSTRPVGLEYRFNVASTVSSIAVAPNGKFLVAGFYNGNVFLYPLTTDSFRFRRGVLLDQITARGMYTQLMVRVALPDDGKFIFAGVYRGSTEIRAFEVDSITFPSSASSVASLAQHDSSDSENDDEDHNDFGMPTARAITHTYSDAKLKGFGAVKSVLRPSTNATEYHLLCGLGIKNIHLWRFFKAPNAQEWSWECIFDKQTNGISLEFITFHRSLSNQIISKSEHQNIRIWTLEEEHDSDFTSVTMHKKSHVDVKGTVDTSVVYGDYAYGGSESLAVVELATATRQELELPLSTKEQDAAQKEAAKSTNSRMTAMMRSRNQRTSGRRRGGADDSGMRHMRTISQVAGRDASPFTVGMCTDGSVFLHHPSKASGLVSNLEYIEGYEQFFQDPSLSFQAQFSDLTRVNTSGLLAVLPLPPTEREDWMVVAANQDQLLVRSYKAFLYRNQQKTEIVRVQRGLRRVMRDLGGRSSGGSSSGSTGSSSSDSGSDHDSGSEKVSREESKRRTIKKEQTRDTPNPASTTPPSRQLEQPPKPKSKPAKVIDKESKHSPIDSVKKTDSKIIGKDVIKTKKPAPSVAEKLSLAAPTEVNEPSEEQRKNAVTTPKRASTPRNSFSTTVASPVVSISSCSSNPNTPEQVGLTRLERQLKAIKELEWTPPPKPSTASKDSNAKSGAVPTEKPSSSESVSKQRENCSSVKEGKTKPRLKAQALFTDNEDQENQNSNTMNVAAVKTVSSDQANSKTKKRSSATLETTPEQEPLTKILKKAEKQIAKPLEQAQTVSATTPVVKQPEEASADVTMAEEGEVDEDEELEELERCEPVFETFPLLSEGGSLLTASLFQYKDAKTCVSKLNGSESPVSVDVLPAPLSPMLVAEKAQLLSNFADQMSRLQMNFESEKRRLYQLHEWSSKKKTSQTPSSSSGSGPMNWKKSLLSDYSKKKQLKRRQKKQLASKLRQLHSNINAQHQDLLTMQRMEASAFAAKQQLHQLFLDMRA